MKWNLQPVWVERVAWGIAALITLAAVWPDSPASVTDRADGCSRIATNTSLGASESAVTKPIAAVRVGDFVLASDPVTGHVGRKRVTRIYHSISDHLRILTLESPSGERQQLKTTDDHPFWVPERGWIEAGDLNVGDNVLQHDQAAATIGATDYEPHPEGIPVYNFETEDLHTYFVAAHGSRAPPVLVHNCGFRSPPKSKPVAPKRKPTRAQKRSRSGHVGDPPHGPTGRSAPRRVGAKHGPKTDANAPHNATIRTHGDLLESGGNKVIAGGGKLPERPIKTPGGVKGGRRPDILFETPNGQIRGRNVGKTDRFGNPIKRELEALDDLNGPGGIPTDFVPYD